MDDLISKLYKRMLSGSAKLMVFGIFVSLVIVAIGAGFAFDFANCFGQSSCSNGAGSYFLILPVGVIILAFVLLRKWRDYQATRYKESVKQEVLNDMGHEGLSQAGELEAVILNMLNTNGALGLDDIVTRTKADKDEVLSIIRELMQKQFVGQEIRGDSTIFFAKKPQD